MEVSQPWQARELNQSGIRRLKIFDAGKVTTDVTGLKTENDLVIYEFIFPADLSCQANVKKQINESGSITWLQSLTFSLPGIDDNVVHWVHVHRQVLWLLVCEDYNGLTRLLGASENGLKLSFQATTEGAGKMTFSYSGELLYAYLSLAGYENSQIFDLGESLEFDSSFDISFS